MNSTCLRRLVLAGCLGTLLGSTVPGQTSTPPTAAPAPVSGVATGRTEAVSPAPAAALAVSGTLAVSTGQVSGVLVRVEGVPITRDRIETEMAGIREMLTPEQANSEMAAMLLGNMKEQILDNAIARELIRNECRKNAIAVTDEEVKKMSALLNKPHLPGVPTPAEAMAKQGLSAKAAEQFLLQMEEQIRMSMQLARLLKVPEPDDAEIDAFYDEYSRLFENFRAQQILIAVNPDDDAAKKKARKEKAESIRKQLVEGKADFAKLSAEHSDSLDKDKGGDLDYFTRGQMLPQIEEAVTTLKSNELSAVIETEYGYLIVKALEHNVASRADMKDRIAFLLKDRQIEKQEKEFLDGLREKANIVYTDEASDFRAGAGPEDGLPLNGMDFDAAPDEDEQPASKDKTPAESTEPGKKR
ncbi:MAG: peptidylprolyl isomerase [Lentisphaerae bacterium]|nr:peptidylprolyl isomerase [Lentisphaerota bacterium]